jgi:hypothetical protein
VWSALRKSRTLFVLSVLQLYNMNPFATKKGDPCGGGVEYLHRDPASCRRRRKGKSQIWDSKIWSQVPRDSYPRKTALARASSTYKRQTRPLVREGAPQEQESNCHISNKYLVVSPKWVLYSKTDWPTDRRSYHKTQTQLRRVQESFQLSSEVPGWLNKKWQEAFIVIPSASFCAKIHF